MSPNDHDAFPEGARVHEYRIVRVLGRGGFGITYLAFDLNLNGPVALKEYFPAGRARRLVHGSVGPASPENRAVFEWGRKSFLAEAQAVHRLRHPNVVRAHRYFEDRGSVFIVMEYVEGDSLAKILKDRGKLTFSEWAPLLDQLLAGLEHVHDREYLHRDLKPGNIVIRDTDGAPVLIDFGSARIAAGERTNTQTVTDGYAPIEQYGKKEQGPPADLYALAAVSYRVLLGERPPSAPDRVTNDTIGRLAERVREAEPGWLAALDHCLAIHPQDRPQSVTEFRRVISEPPQVAAAGVPQNGDRLRTSEPSDRLERIGRTDEDYKDSRRFTNVTKGLLYAGVALSFFGLLSRALSYFLLDAESAGLNRWNSALQRNLGLQVGIGIIGLSVRVPTTILVLSWIRRANCNMRALGAKGLRFSPAGSIGWYFVPLLSLWRPYQAMREIWQGSMNPRDWLAVPVPRMLPFWWSLWCVSWCLSILYGSLFWALVGSSSTGGLVAINIVAEVWVLVDAAAALLLMTIMARIQRAQAEYLSAEGASAT